VALAVLAGLHSSGVIRWFDVAAVLVGALAVNIYIVGINQVTDVEIDRINKPWLPLASGAMSLRAGRVLSWGGAALALAVGLATGPFALAAFAVGFAIGTAYSLPPLRLKRSAMWAAACITVVRGLAVNLLLFWHFLEVAGTPPRVPPVLVALTAVIVALSLVIAWFKDIPDIDGDRRFKVRTLSVRFGARWVLGLGVAVLVCAYGAMVVVGLVGVPGLHGATLVVAHLAAIVVLVVAGLRVDLARRPSVARFYLLIWGLFYVEYVVFSAAGLLA
jgi:homogentisate phytyltransferase/homogentisate geranylgeranyltransferase